MFKVDVFPHARAVLVTFAIFSLLPNCGPQSADTAASSDSREPVDDPSRTTPPVDGGDFHTDETVNHAGDASVDEDPSSAPLYGSPPSPRSRSRPRSPRPSPQLDVSGDGTLCLRFHDEDGSPRRMHDRVTVVDHSEATVVRLAVAERLTAAGGEATIEMDHSYFDRAFFVWAPDGESTWIDLHLSDGVKVADDAVSLDFGDGVRPAGDEPDAGVRLLVNSEAIRESDSTEYSEPKRTTNVVLLSPREGIRLDSGDVLEVQGYARTFEANVVLRLVTDEPVYETFTTASSWADAWGWFDMSVDPGKLPAGEFRVEVGEHSAKDGTWQGVSVDVRRE